MEVAEEERLRFVVPRGMSGVCSSGNGEEAEDLSPEASSEVMLLGRCNGAESSFAFDSNSMNISASLPAAFVRCSASGEPPPLPNNVGSKISMLTVFTTMHPPIDAEFLKDWVPLSVPLVVEVSVLVVVVGSVEVLVVVEVLVAVEVMVEGVAVLSVEMVVVEGLEVLGSDDGDIFPDCEVDDLFPRVSSWMSVDWKFLNDSFTSSKNRNCSLSRVTCKGCGRWRRKETLG